MAGRPRRRRKMRRMNRKRFQNYYSGQRTNRQDGSGVALLMGALAAFAYRQYQKSSKPLKSLFLTQQKIIE